MSAGQQPVECSQLRETPATHSRTAVLACRALGAVSGAPACLMVGHHAAGRRHVSPARAAFAPLNLPSFTMIGPTARRRPPWSWPTGGKRGSTAEKAASFSHRRPPIARLGLIRTSHRPAIRRWAAVRICPGTTPCEKSHSPKRGFACQKGLYGATPGSETAARRSVQACRRRIRADANWTSVSTRFR